MSKSCQARIKRNTTTICGKDCSTTRIFQAAPGLWIQVPLCYEHQVIWDQAQDFEGPKAIRESINEVVQPVRIVGTDREMSWDDMRHIYTPPPESNDRPYMENG